MGKYYEMIWAYGNSLAHYGVKGQKWGMRRYRNEDGSLTSEGRDHYGIGDPRRPSATGSNQSNARKAEHNYRVNKFGSASAKTLEKKPKQLSEQEQQARKEKAKKILKTAAIVGVSLAAIGYGVHKTTKIRNDIRDLARIKNNDLVRRANQAASNSLEYNMVSDYSKYRAKSGESSGFNKTAAVYKKSADDAQKQATHLYAKASKYADMSKKLNRRNAMKIYLKNRGKIRYDSI